MATAGVRQPKEVIARIGVDLLESKIYPTLDPADQGKFVAVDTLSGEYEIDRSELAALDRLHQRCPRAEPFLGRFGHSAAYESRSLR